MQNVSQPDKPSRRQRAPKRGPKNGNILWRLFQELGYSGKQAFWEQVGVCTAAFSKHSKASYSLGRMDTRFFFAYRDFFLAHGGHDIMEDYHGEGRPSQRPVLASDQFHENEAA